MSGLMMRSLWPRPSSDIDPAQGLSRSIFLRLNTPPEDIVAKVSWNGEVRFKGRRLKAPKALLNLPIAFRPDRSQDGAYDVYYCHHCFMRLDLHNDGKFR